MDFVGDALGIQSLVCWGILIGALLIAGLVAYLIWTGPPRFRRPPYASPRPIFVASLEGQHRKQFEGSVGEFLTALMMVSEGWRQLPSQPGTDGVDGIFIRGLGRNGSKFKVCLVETKTTIVGRQKYGSYESGDMSNNTLIKKKLAELADAEFHERPYFSSQALKAISRGLERGSRFVRKRLVVHRFCDNRTEMYHISASGEPSKNPFRKISGKDYEPLVEALEIGLARLMRVSGLKDDPHVINIREVAMQDEPPTQRSS